MRVTGNGQVRWSRFLGLWRSAYRLALDGSYLLRRSGRQKGIIVMANYGRIGFYSFKQGTLDPLIEKARAEPVPMTQQLPGFLRYALVRTGPDSVASLSAWETREQSAQAAQQLAGWVRENFGPGLLSVDNHIGEIVLSDWSGTHQPDWGRVSAFTFNRPVSDLVSTVRDDYMPQLKQRPGFNTYTVWQTGEATAISYITFDTKEHGEAGMAAGRPWIQEHIGPRTKDVKWLEGDLVWTVRKG